MSDVMTNSGPKSTRVKPTRDDSEMKTSVGTYSWYCNNAC